VCVVKPHGAAITLLLCCMLYWVVVSYDDALITEQPQS
jgi:hypothetical protein